jgi:serine/threonine protein kinase/predicted Zn-dependent protease
MTKEHSQPPDKNIINKNTIIGCPGGDAINKVDSASYSPTLPFSDLQKLHATDNFQKSKKDFEIAKTMVATSKQAEFDEETYQSRLFENIASEYPNKYLFKGEIGKGGIGKVSLSYDTHIGRNVAIKELLPRFVTQIDPSEKSRHNTIPNHSEIRFLNEARITGFLEHPGIISVYEIGLKAEGGVYYAMQFVEGKTFSLILKNRPLIKRLELLNHFVEVCNAVAYAHNNGVIHRDLKPENIMLGKFGETIVLDWGLAKKQNSEDITKGELAIELEKLKSEMDLQTPKGPMGTPQYMSPEQARGDVEKVDELSDIYTLGAILYEILTGHPPFREKTPLATIFSLLEDELKPPCTLDKNIPSELAAIAEKALSKDKSMRYQSALELAAEVKRWQNGGLVRSYDYSPLTLLKKWIVKHKKGVITSLILIATFFGAWSFRGKQDSNKRAKEEKNRKSLIIQEVKSIINLVSKKAKKETNWFDTYTFKLISMKEAATEKYILTQLSHPNELVRKLVVRSLGGMKSKKAVLPLMKILKTKSEKSTTIIIEIIKTLGIIGDSRANNIVQKIRWDSGQFSVLWSHTKIAYTMLPVHEKVDLSKLSSLELHLRGKAYFNKRIFKKAKDMFLLSIKKDPTDFKPYNMLGLIYRIEENNKKAIYYFSKSIELSPEESAFALSNRGLLYRKSEHYTLALKDFNQAIRMNPEFPSVYNNRAILHLAMGNYDKIEEDYKKALSLNPNSATYYFNLAAYYLHMKDISKAKESLSKSLLLNKNKVNSNLLLVEINLRELNFDSAKSVLDKLFEIHPQNLSILYHYIAMTYLQNNISGLKYYVNLISNSSSTSRHARKYLYLGWYLLGQYEKSYKISVDNFNRKGNNPKVKQYMMIRRIPLLLKLAKQHEIRPLLNSLVVSDEKQWIDYIHLYLLGKTDVNSFKKQAFSAERKIEFNFYAGLKAEIDNNLEIALNYYKETIKSTYIRKNEYFYALKYIKDNTP